MCPDYVSNMVRIGTMELTEFYPPLGRELVNFSFLRLPPNCCPEGLNFDKIYRKVMTA